MTDQKEVGACPNPTCEKVIYYGTHVWASFYGVGCCSEQCCNRTTPMDVQIYIKNQLEKQHSREPGW